MRKFHYLTVVQILLLLVFLFIMDLWKGVVLAILFFIVWVDKAILTRTKYQADFGYELITIPAIISGMVYGPEFGFIFGFLIIPLFGGIFELLTWNIVQPYKPDWMLPIIPSLSSFAWGIGGALGGLIGNEVSIITVVLITTIIRSILLYFKDQIIGWPPRLAYVLNIIFNLILVVAFEHYINILISWA